MDFKFYKNIVIPKTNEFYFNILVPPRWIIEPTDKAFAQGSDAKIECKADGFPRPQVTWKKASGTKLLTFCNILYFFRHVKIVFGLI